MKFSGRRPVALLSALLVLLTPFTCLANGSANCFEEAAVLVSPGSRLILTDVEGTSISGRLQFADFREKVLTLEAGGPEQPARTIHLSEVASIRYTTSASVTGGMATGALFGAGAGLAAAVIGTVMTNEASCRCDPNPQSDYGSIIMLVAFPTFGAIAGMLSGAVIAGSRKVQRTIDCGARP
jgi:hypothetical protein